MTRILVVGAGATGGALGARLAEAGRDVTFLVRERRAAQLAADGLRHRTPDGESTRQVRALTTLDGEDPFDLVVVTVKAPGIPAVLETIRPAVGPRTRIVPLLNGMAHLDPLEEAFGGQVLGGIVKIVATLDDQATVVQMTPLFTVTIGGLHGDAVPQELVEALDVDGVDLQVVDDVVDRLWEKWAFIAASGVVCCLFRGCVGDILAAGGETLVTQAIEECEQVAAAAGHPVSDEGHGLSTGMLLEPGSAFTSSLYRDLQHGDPQEAEHIIGRLSGQAHELGVATPLLDATALQLRTHHQALLRARD